MRSYYYFTILYLCDDRQSIETKPVLMVHISYHSCVDILQIEYETRNQACACTNIPSYQKQYHSTLGVWKPSLCLY